MSTAHKKHPYCKKSVKDSQLVQSLQEARFYMVPLFWHSVLPSCLKIKKVDETNIQLANSWIGVNNHLIEKVLPNLKWDMGIGSSTALLASLAGRKRPRKRRFGHRSGTDRGFMRGFSTSRGHAAAQCVAISHRIPAQGRAQPCGVVAASDRTLAWLPAVWPAPHHAAGGGARAAGR